jgi:hypothetical protein
MKSLTQRFFAGSACFLLGLFGLLACAAPTASATTADAPPPAADPLEVRSPDGTIVVTLQVKGPLTYSVTVDGNPVITDARLGLKLREGTTSETTSSSPAPPPAAKTPPGKTRSANAALSATTIASSPRYSRNVRRATARFN